MFHNPMAKDFFMIVLTHGFDDFMRMKRLS